MRTDASAIIATVASNTTIEDQFTVAKKALDDAVSNKTLREYFDDQELRTLRALGLQAIRGDCEKSMQTSSNGALFKTEAEASGVEIEKTDALWGAWCIFSGRYQSDAMREYITATHSWREHAASEALESAYPSTRIKRIPLPFDEYAASIDDVISPEAIQVLKEKSKFISKHLSDSDIRMLSALSLQASFGDCNHYANSHGKDQENERDLIDPTFR